MVKGKSYAIAKARSTYGEDAFGIAALRDMTVGGGSTVNGFYKAANQFGFTFNWAYASRKHVAYFSSGKLPIRAKGTNKLLPTLGTGRYDWKGFLPLARHPHAVDPESGLILNWNNKPAPGWQAGEDNLSYGSVHRVEAFYHFPQEGEDRGRRLDHEQGGDRGRDGHAGLAGPARGARHGRRRRATGRSSPTSS